MNPERFRNSTVGRVIKVGQGEAAYWAFVPNPLPPDLPLDNKVWQALSNADRALGELAGLGRTIPHPRLLIQPFIRREAVLSSRIEGTQADIAGLYAFEAGQLQLFPNERPTSLESDLREVLNYVRAMEHGMERLNTLPIGLRLIRELHERLMKDVRGTQFASGEFRRSQNWIGGSDPVNAEFVPPPVDEMHDALDQFEKYLHRHENQYPPLIRLALIHYQFEAIHPFLDGNGRIGRLLIPLLLINWQILPSPLLYLSAYFERQRERYVDLLLGISERGDWLAWLLFFLTGVQEQARDAIYRAKQLQDLQQKWREQLTGARASTLLVRLVDNLFESPTLTIPQAQHMLEVTYQGARLNVEKLVKVGILKQVDIPSRARVFFAPEILRITADNKVNNG